MTGDVLIRVCPLRFGHFPSAKLQYRMKGRVMKVSKYSVSLKPVNLYLSRDKIKTIEIIILNDMIMWNTSSFESYVLMH